MRTHLLSLAQPVPSFLPLLLGVPAIALLVMRRAYWLRAGLVAFLLMLALYHPADRLLFAAAVPLLVASSFRQGDFAAAFAFRPAAVFIGLALIMLVARVLVPLDFADSAVTPKSALSHLPPALLRAPVLNEACFGGYLATHEVKPFIDTRPIYPGAFRTRYGHLGDPKILAETLVRYHIRWSVLAPTNPAVKALDGMKGWHRLYSDPVAVVHIKNEAL